MAGYVFGLDSIESLEMYTWNGVYATRLPAPERRWYRHHEGTFADYATMKPGDNVYFFIDRKIYGIGELVEVAHDCKFLNFPDANTPKAFDYASVRHLMLWDEGPHSVNQRWLCVFKPSPRFFKNGIDMDDALASRPSSFRMLRAFWKVSFVKVDDDENQAIVDAIARANRAALRGPGGDVFSSNYGEFHQRLSARAGSEYHLGCEDVLLACADGSRINHEMAIEASLLYQLASRDPAAVGVFGEWDYLSHQVVASPFKPIDYMDRMDVFGYSYLGGFERTRADYLVAEVKNDTAGIADVDQLMKYVDWVKDEYCFGNYSMVKAFLVAFDFPQDVVAHARRVGERKYIVGRRPSHSGVWSDLKLVNYAFDSTSRSLSYHVV